jgi:hypothetical protein
MSQAEEDYVAKRAEMEQVIREFHELADRCGIDNDGFASDVKDAVYDATDQQVKFED